MSLLQLSNCTIDEKQTLYQGLSCTVHRICFTRQTKHEDSQRRKEVAHSKVVTQGTGIRQDLRLEHNLTSISILFLLQAVYVVPDAGSSS
jgi:hypothetical protein